VRPLLSPLPLPLPPCRRPVVRLALLALCLLPGAPLAAQARRDSVQRDATRRDSAQRDSAQRDSAGAALEAVRVRAAYRPRVTGSASASVITPDSLPLGAVAPVMGDVLRRMPFLYVRQNARGESELSVRGSESRQAAVLFDGVPLTLTWDARADVSAVPLGGVQQVEYVRGLSSLLAGPNAIGGVISTRLFADHDPTRPPERLGRLDVQADQFGGLRTSALVGGAVRHSADRSIAVRAGAGFRDLPGLARPGDVREPGGRDRLRLNTDARSVDAFAAARYEHAQGRYLAAFVSALEGARGVAPELHLDQPRLWRNPVVQRRIASVSAGTGGLRSRLGVGDVEVSAGYNAGLVDIESFATRDYAEVTGTERGDDRTLTARVTFDQQLGPRAVWRGAFTHAEVRYLETIGQAPTATYRQRLQSLASELDLLPTRFLTLTAGLSADAATTDEAGGREPLGRKDGLGWRVGATWFLPARGLRLHASASERRRFPALRELYSGALGRFVPNPALRPETAHGAEAGVTLARAAFDLQVVAFSQRIDDAVVRTTLPDRRFFRLNRDRFTSHGLEATAGTALGPVALRGDVTWQRARLTDATLRDAEWRRPEDVPEVFGSLLATGRLGGGVDGLARLRTLGETRCLTGDAVARQAGATALDLGLERTWFGAGLFGRLRGVLQLENALDRAVYDKCGLPQVGRTVRLGLTLG
jgi:iron complex outermembrane receptor protein